MNNNQVWFEVSVLCARVRMSGRRRGWRARQSSSTAVTPGSWRTAAAERSETSIRTGTASHLATLVQSAVIGTSTRY